MKLGDAGHDSLVDTAAADARNRAANAVPTPQLQHCIDGSGVHEVLGIGEQRRAVAMTASAAGACRWQMLGLRGGGLEWDDLSDFSDADIPLLEHHGIDVPLPLSARPRRLSRPFRLRDEYPAHGILLPDDPTTAGTRRWREIKRQVREARDRRETERTTWSWLSRGLAAEAADLRSEGDGHGAR